MQNLIINITQENFKLLENNNYECFILSSDLDGLFKKTFIIEAHKKNKICLLFGKTAAEEYTSIDADGIVLDLSKEESPQKIIKEFKQKNPKALLGVISRNRRHESMLISECEPEFIIFKVWSDGIDKTKELLEWYNEFFLIQSAIMPMDNCRTEELTADFLIKEDSVL